MMDSRGHVHVIEDDVASVDGARLEGIAREVERHRHTGFVSKHPMPEQCDPRKVLSALDKLTNATEPPKTSDSALLPLTPFEKGYVLGVLGEYQAWRREHP